MGDNHKFLFVLVFNANLSDPGTIMHAGVNGLKFRGDVKDNAAQIKNNPKAANRMIVA